MLLEKNIRKPKELNLLALEYVTAEAQARAYGKIAELLTECEADVFKRAYNSTHLNKPKHASGKEYRIATGFEAVIGMLEWMGNDGRITELLTAAYKEKENDTEN
jgi:ribonuclease-3 family protein